jgi:hypothetical protein
VGNGTPVKTHEFAGIDGRLARFQRLERVAARRAANTIHNPAALAASLSNGRGTLDLCGRLGFSRLAGEYSGSFLELVPLIPIKGLSNAF